MEQDQEFRQKQVEEYKQSLAPLLRYLPWLEKSAGDSASRIYSGMEMGEDVMGFPVYDSSLINFVKDAQKTKFMDRNYRYVYTRNGIKNHDDERRLIKNATINEWNILCGILSYYVMGGRTKATLWNEAVKAGIFRDVVRKMCEIVEYWDKSLKK